MPFRSVEGTRSSPHRRAGPPAEDQLQAAFAAAPATIIDSLRPSEAPTRESRDVIEALAAHEFSLAHQAALPEE